MIPHLHIPIKRIKHIKCEVCTPGSAAKTQTLISIILNFYVIF